MRDVEGLWLVGCVDAIPFESEGRRVIARFLALGACLETHFPGSSHRVELEGSIDFNTK